MKNAFRFLCILLALLIVFSLASCKQDAGESVQPEEEPAGYTTKFYMPHGWNVTIPAWSEPDEGGAKNLKPAVLSGDGATEVTNINAELIEALNAAKADKNFFKEPKNIIIIIGDGMGIRDVRASEQWSGDLIMTQLPNIGASKTYTREGTGVVTDSGAGGNAISTGYKTTKLFLNMDAEGNNLKSVSELAREQGKLVGIVTNAELADATPADFSVHNKNRSQGWTKICQQEVVFGADLFMGNGLSDYSSYFSSGSTMYPFVEKNNLTLCVNSAESAISNFNEEKVWVLFEDGKKNSDFARFDMKTKLWPNLQQMTYYALSWLDSHADEEGFIVMIENTYTDGFGHGSSIKAKDGSPNTYGIVKEVQSTDEAVAIALKYVLEHPDTALIVTADHETGNMILPGDWAEDFSSIYADSGNHSLQDVPVFAIGKGTEALNSLTDEARAAGKKWYEATPYENAVIGQVIGALLGDDEFGGDVNTDSSSKTSAAFTVTTTAAASQLSFTLNLKGVPVFDGNIIQFKIKPANSSDSIKVELKPKTGTAVSQLASTVFSSTDSAKIVTDKDGNVTTPLMKAYKQAFVTGSGEATGWYQISVPATISSDQIVITLTCGNGSFPAGTQIGMDDLTIQYASTIGELHFTSTNATATGACLYVEPTPTP